MKGVFFPSHLTRHVQGRQTGEILIEKKTSSFNRRIWAKEISEAIRKIKSGKLVGLDNIC